MNEKFYAYFLGGPLDMTKKAVGSLPANNLYMACREKPVSYQFEVEDLPRHECARLKAYKLATELSTRYGETYFVYLYEGD